jgi:acetolactate synthase-1/3 small subunit
MRYTLGVLVENKPGVLTHISGLISRRAFNIESIAAGYTEEPDTTRITVVVQADENELEQIVNQLSKLIDVIKIVDLTSIDSIQRELALIKVKASAEFRSNIVDIVDIFRAKIVDVNRETMVIELTGEESKIDALCEVLIDYGIIEIVRTGKIALSRGPIPAKEM